MRLHSRNKIRRAVSLAPDYSARLAHSFGLKLGTAEDSRLRALHNNDDALAWRIALIEQAQHSIDAQYYSWHLDMTGLLLIDRLIDAADRGVRVRILLDDIHMFGLDRQIATLNRHDNIEVRLFNPFTYRSRFKLIRMLELLYNLNRLNHRMHNKLLVADNLVAIAGGRNIGDEYFNLHESFLFRDLDLMLVGKCIEELSDSFDVYWNHHHSYTARKIISLRPGVRELDHLRAQIKKRLQSSQSEISDIDLRKQGLFDDEQAALLPIKAGIEIFYDSPTMDNTGGKQTIDTLYECLLQTREQIIIISAYFVPDEALIETIRQLREKNIRIAVYTNSLASIDVTVAFSGYERCRQHLLELGVELYEYRAWTDNPHALDRRQALHTKCIVYDSDKAYVGTLNLDPRSACLNTEIALLIDSPELAMTIRDNISQQKNTRHYWRVEMDPTSGPRWHCGNTCLSVQPSRGRWQRISNWLFSFIPIHRHL